MAPRAAPLAHRTLKPPPRVPPALRPRTCPHCHSPHVLAEDGACPRCFGRWAPRALLADALGGAGADAAKRAAARGPLTSLNCPDCRFALKSFDVPGPQHEGDLFWGLESPRPAGTAVAEGCARCGGLWVSGPDLARAGGWGAFVANLAASVR